MNGKAVLLLVWAAWADTLASAGEAGAKRDWPGDEIYESILAGKDRDSFHIYLFKGGMRNSQLTLYGNLTGKYEINASYQDFIPNKPLPEVGRYSVKVTETQLRALLEVLKQRQFPTLHTKERIVMDEAVSMVSLHYRNKTWTEVFPLLPEEPVPQAYERMWEAISATLAQSEILPETVVRARIAMPKRTRRGAVTPIAIQVLNAGKTDICIHNPALAGCSFDIDWEGPASSVRNPERGFCRIELGSEKAAPEVLRLPVGQSTEIRVYPLLFLRRPGAYRVFAELTVSYPQMRDGAPDEALAVWGRLATGEIPVSVE